MGVGGSGCKWVGVDRSGWGGSGWEYGSVQPYFIWLFNVISNEGEIWNKLTLSFEINWKHSKHGTIIRTGITCKKISV